MSLTFGLLLAASVSVDLSALEAGARARLDVDGLHGQLLVRLAEDGFAVRAASKPTSYRLEVGVTPAGNAVLRVVGEQVRRAELAEAPRAVLHLELVQRALVLLDEVPPAPIRPMSLPRVFLQFPAHGDPETANRMYGRVAVKLVEEGFELVGAADRAAHLVSISSAGDLVWRAAAAPAGLSTAPRTAGPPGTSPALGRLERESSRSGRSSESVALMLGTSGGVVARGNHFDLGSALSLRIGRDSGFCAVMMGRFTPVQGQGMELIEVGAAVGPGWRFPVGRLRFEASLLAGALHQRYQRWSESAELRWSWLLVAPLDLSLRLGRSWRIHGAVLPSVTRQERFFPEPWIPPAPETSEGWANGVFQIALDAGVSFTF